MRPRGIRDKEGDKSNHEGGQKEETKNPEEIEREGMGKESRDGKRRKGWEETEGMGRERSDGKREE